jgi:CheY-like chemotaxis protein/AraC-like DNA-binding protein
MLERPQAAQVKPIFTAPVHARGCCRRHGVHIVSPDSPRILVIDDEPESIRMLVAFLRDLYPEVMIACDGFDGLEKAAKGEPDVILLDMSMPLLSGIDVCRRLKADPKLAPIPVIFLTAHSFIEEKLAAFAAGGVDYVTKPFSDREVLARIAVHSRANQRHRNREAAAGDTHSADPAPPPRHPDRVLVGKACEYLRENLSAQLSLAELAASLKVTVPKLDSSFRKQLGLSVFFYLIELRLEAARRLLRDTEMQIQQIAWTVGYTPGDLSRAFSLRFGMSPRRFRSEVVLGDRGDGTRAA